MILKGKVHKYGSNVNTDEIIPARYLNTTDPAILSKYCMEDIDRNFAKNVKAGDIIVAENNFGCGSSREHAPITIKASGISAVIANSFARIFFRNSINIGLPILESPEAAKAIENGDTVEINLTKGIIKNVTKNGSYQSQPFPEFMQKIIKSGGLLGYINIKS
ncbi:3-isopropylmalate dehydratase [Candidatus Endomicrobiellum trichonymphae]|uniref:3-isopropylmalate dehydratase small subunit n=1 Tax=Endomicrobium trichonymphae TaxID=1408204 RepID=A0A1E5IKK2_ENDTX|nr:3-isopropylmalate dehydratase [Candidatus Endomicrobium trichonymphae]